MAPKQLTSEAPPKAPMGPPPQGRLAEQPKSIGAAPLRMRSRLVSAADFSIGLEPEDQGVPTNFRV